MPSLPRAALLLVLLALPACASSAAPPDAAPQPTDAPESPTAAPRASASAPPPSKRGSDDGPVAEEEIDPDAQRAFKANMAKPAIPLGPASEAPRATAGALADTARGEAAGMKPLGELAVATLREGQRAMMPVTLAPGECATFIAEGGLGVIEVDVFLTTTGGADARILAQDPGNGPIGVIGGHGHCYANDKAAPLSVELQVTVRRGAGVVLLQGYQAVKRP
jgi:hypothetical protein